MSMLTAKIKKLRTMAVHFVFEDGCYDYYDKRDIAWALCDAADTIENLRNRLTERDTCHTEDYVCPQCGTVMDYVTRGDDDEKVIPMDDYVIPLHYCPHCGRRVVG